MKTPSPPKRKVEHKKATKLPVPVVAKENHVAAGTSKVSYMAEPPSNVKRKDNMRGKSTGRRAIENYRPGYTWNRGGRLKELRIRFVCLYFAIIFVKEFIVCIFPERVENKIEYLCFCFILS